MSAEIQQDWTSRNQAKLTEELAGLKALLRQHGEGAKVAEEKPKPKRGKEKQAAKTELRNDEAAPLGEGGSATATSALDRLCAAFGLSAFERSVILLAAGMELDSSVAALCATAQGDLNKNFPTFSLALAVLPNAHWSALTPEGALRRWRLIEIGAGPALTASPLRIDERVLHYLAGAAHLDERLAATVEIAPSPADGDLAASHSKIAVEVAAALSTSRESRSLPVIQLCSADPAQLRPITAAIAKGFGMRALVLSSELVPAPAADLETFARLWERESVLSNSLLVLECSADADARANQHQRFVERITGPIIITSREPRRFQGRPTIVHHVSQASTAEQKAGWRNALGISGDSLRADSLAAQFNLSLPMIRSVAAEAVARGGAGPERDVVAEAWQSCREICRARLDGLAQRIEPNAGWEDIVLPETQMQVLRQVGAQVRHRTEVYENWGFAGKSSRGLGIAVLFAGVSGAGKTMAAEILANELRLDLYRIDLASVVSKYIGETEKNLRRVFDAAEESGSILLFDEADALFGKRSEVKDSHDRYANIEVSYLLQRMESYRGLAILTTNLKSALDPAFFRRLRFVVQFPFPDPPQRAEIWRRIFPRATPTENLDFNRLARLNLPGGNIRNIAMSAAFLAAAEGQSVRMPHLLVAARAEYSKLERVLTDAEIAGWNLITGGTAL